MGKYGDAIVCKTETDLLHPFFVKFFNSPVFTDNFFENGKDHRNSMVKLEAGADIERRQDNAYG